MEFKTFEKRFKNEVNALKIKLLSFFKFKFNTYRIIL